MIETREVVQLPLRTAIVSLLGKREDKRYQNLGVELTAKELAKVIGLTNTPMLYNYASGKTATMEAERAVVLLDRFGILLDDWHSTKELQLAVTNRKLGKKIAYEPIKEIMGELVEATHEENEQKFRRKILALIAKYY